LSKIFQRRCGQEPPAIVVEPLQLQQNASLSNPDLSLGTKKVGSNVGDILGGGGSGHNHHFVFSQKGGVRILCGLVGFRRFIKATEDFI